MSRNKLFHAVAAIASTSFVLFAIGSQSIESISFAKNSSIETKPKIEQAHLSIRTETETPKTEETIITYDSNVTWNKKQLPKATLARFKKPKHLPWMKVPKGFENDLNFWIDVYSKYHDHEVILHDPKKIDRIYYIIDLSNDYYRKDISDEERREILSNRIDDIREKYSTLILELAIDPNTASPDSQKLRKLFPANTTSEEFTEASENIRAQWGQKEKFQKGLKQSGRILGEMERIFINANVPPVITRLALVESTFIYSAKSDAGAAGLWQFMPGTGKIYMRIDESIDERLDPLKSTAAAAIHLRRNYEELGTWPLAINAYNAGRTRLRQATKKLRTRDIGKIMRKFDHPSYGFASRNFFLEFVAAALVADNYPIHFEEIEFDEPLEFVEVNFPKPVNMRKVIIASGAPEADIMHLNHSLRKGVWTGNHPVPALYSIRIPESNAGDIIEAAPKHYISVPAYHIVGYHENWAEIAAKYGLRVSELKNLNRRYCKKGRCKLKRGMKLRLSTNNLAKN